MITINTKTPQLVDPARNLSAVVYLEIINKVHHFENDRFEFGIRYYYEVTEGEGEQAVTTRHTLPFKRQGRQLTREQVNAVAATVTPTADNYVDVERQYVLNGAFAIVHADSAENWGLTANDWEVTQ